MSIQDNKLTLVCSSVQRIQEHGIESNVVVLTSRDSQHDVLRLEEFASPSNFSVGRLYEISVAPVCDA